MVTFFPGETSAQVQVPITDDTFVEGTEQFSASLSTTDTNVVLGDDTASVTILDNDGNNNSYVSASEKKVCQHVCVSKYEKWFYCAIIFLVIVTFDPTVYNVTEGMNNFAELTIVRSGKLSEVTTVTVTTLSGTALGMSSS